MRDQGVGAQAALLVLFIGLEVALEPFDVAVALEGQNVRRKTVKEPAVVMAIAQLIRARALSAAYALS